MKKAGFLALVFSAASAWAASAAYAQVPPPYPNRPVRFILASGAGGLVDTITRTLATHLSERLGQPVVVDNRPGASEAIAAEAVARSPADGHTIYMASEAAIVFNGILRKSLPYNPQRDFTPVTMVAESPYYLVVNPSVPARSVGELVALARSQPGVLMFASTGNGTMQHLLAELFKSRTRVSLLHVPYKQSSPAMLDLVSGRVHIMFQGGQTPIANIRSGKLTGLGVTSARRIEEAPGVPTMGEAGVPDFEASSWFGLFGPAGLPQPVVERLNREAGDLLRNPETARKLGPLGIQLVPGTPEQLAARVRRDYPFWSKVIRDAGIEGE